MIKEFSVRPKPKNNNAKIVFTCLLIFSAVGFIASSIMVLYKGIVGTVALFVLVTAILIYTKYISPFFSYDVCLDSAGTPIFVVRQTVGKRISTLCRIDLADISEIKHETRDEKRKHITPKGYKKYVYAPTMFPPSVFRITVKSNYESSEILIEITEEVAELLRRYVLEAQELRLVSGEEE